MRDITRCRGLYEIIYLYTYLGIARFSVELENACDTLQGSLIENNPSCRSGSR